MRTRITIATLLLSVFILSCDGFNSVIPVEEVSIQQKDFSDYQRIEVESAFTVYVNFSDTEEKIEIEANDNLHQYIEVDKVGGTLKIGFRNNTNVNGSATLNAYLTTKNVTGYSASGASRIILNDVLTAENADIFLSGASSFTGELEVINLSASMSGASTLNLTGSCESFDVEASGASNIFDFDFYCDYLNISLSGASNASLTINQRIDVDASGASIVRYKGQGKINSQKLTGNSKIMKID